MSLEGRRTIYMHTLRPVWSNTENCFVKRYNEAVEKQSVSFSENSEPTEAKVEGPSKENNIMFVKN